MTNCSPLCGASKAYGRFDQPWKHEPQCPVRLEWEAAKAAVQLVDLAARDSQQVAGVVGAGHRDRFLGLREGDLMPYKDPEKRRETHTRWSKSRSPGYMKWLYQKRQLQRLLAERYEQALQEIGHLNANTRARRIAYQALTDGQTLKDRVGRRYDHEHDRPAEGWSAD